MSTLFKYTLLTAAVSLLSVEAQHVHFEPPWVQSVVAEATQRYGNYLWYKGGNWADGSGAGSAQATGYQQGGSGSDAEGYGSEGGSGAEHGSEGKTGCKPAQSPVGPGQESSASGWGESGWSTPTTSASSGWGSPGGWETTNSYTASNSWSSVAPWSGLTTPSWTTSTTPGQYGTWTTSQYGYASSSSSTASAASSKSTTSTGPLSSSTITTTQASTLSSSTTASGTTSSTSLAATCAYWMDNIKHQGFAPFAPGGYAVYRNVLDYGATGNGVTDDTAAINAAISDGGRCAPGSCASSTETPAVVYFPPGTYLISSSIIDYYFTQLIGNPNCIPTLKATAGFTGFGLIDGDVYGANGLSYGSTNVFWRQVRNFIIDMTDIPGSSSATGIHWPTAQATSLQNIVFLMNENTGTQHQGVFCESGSGGFMTDLVFYGGLYGANWGNQQFTMRNLTFYNCVTAILQIWDWGFTYKGLNVNNCSYGLNMTDGGPTDQQVGSVVIIDSTFTDTPVAVLTAHSSDSQPPSAGTLILENVALNNVGVAVEGADGVDLAGGTYTIAGWAEGHTYTPTGPNNVEGNITPNNRPASLVSTNGYYQRSKPQYGTVPASGFLSARSAGAVGDSSTDDTAALQGAINQAASSGLILFLDYGLYKVTSTITIPAGSKIVGESYAVILGSGATFSDMSNPTPVVRIGTTGQTGSVELSDFIVSTQGATEGAVLFEYNLASSSSAPSGLWDVHARIGGFAGSNLQVSQCPTTPSTSTPPAPVNSNCIAAFLTFHVTPAASGLYLENVWLWTADHDVEDPNLTQITIYTGRGLYVESTAGTIWLYGTAVEHHAAYQYQFANTRNVFMGFIQTETAYYQPNPPAPQPFPYDAALNDPQFPAACYAATGATFNYTGAGSPTNNCDGLGLRMLDSADLLVYGAGLYSFFSDYSTTCSDQGNGEACQNSIFHVDGAASGISVYALSTVGTTDMITRNGQAVALYSDNLDGFVDTIAIYRTG